MKRAVSSSKRSAKLARTPAVPTGSVVKRQPSLSPSASASRVGGLGGLSALFSAFGGFGGSGTFATYRAMRSNPTIALAIAATTAPVKAAPWGYKEKDNAPEGAIELVQDTFDRLKHDLVKEMVRATYYGFQAFERVYTIRDGMETYEKFKPLLPDLTSPLIDDYGNVIGLENHGVKLDARKAFWFTYDGEAGDPFGRSRMENIRESAWRPWMDGIGKYGRYVAKTAGIIPQITYPEGKTQGADGVERDNWEHARDVLTTLASGEGVYMPFTISDWAEDWLRKGGDPKQVMAWQIGFLETKSGAGAEMLDGIKHFEALMVRGWLSPERAVLEGTSGTKAEAETHTDILLATADELHKDIVQAVNRTLVPDLLALNYGEEYRESVCVEAGPLTADDRAFFRELMREILTQPGNVDLLMSTVDLDGAMDKADIPKIAEMIDQGQITRNDGGDGGDPGQPTPPPAPNPPGSPEKTPVSASRLFDYVRKERKRRAA